MCEYEELKSRRKATMKAAIRICAGAASASFWLFHRRLRVSDSDTRTNAWPGVRRGMLKDKQKFPDSYILWVMHLIGLHLMGRASYGRVSHRRASCMRICCEGDKGTP